MGGLAWYRAEYKVDLPCQLIIQVHPIFEGSDPKSHLNQNSQLLEQYGPCKVCLAMPLFLGEDVTDPNGRCSVGA